VRRIDRGSHTNKDRKCLDSDSITLVSVYDQGTLGRRLGCNNFTVKVYPL
jgi:hypothetical protein